MATLSGVVSDPSGARVQHANVHVASTDGTLSRDLESDGSGRFSLSVPAHETYDVVVTSAGFDPFFKELKVNANTGVDARLVIATGQTVIEVSGDNNGLSTSADANKTAIDLKGDQLNELSDDDATFQQQLIAMAGGGGPQGPQIYVDGFENGTIPPKSSIREVKINQNPYSAEYDSLGFGRIEILTKPGTGQIHGEVDVAGDPSGFNSRNPFLYGINQPGYYRLHTRGNLSGPIDKKTSFFISADYYDQQDNAIVNAQNVDASGHIYGVSEAVPDPTGTGEYSVRLDRQWTANNTMTARYELDRVRQTNAGLSQYVLPTEAFGSGTSTHTLQLKDTEVLGAHAELDSMFEYIHLNSSQIPVSDAPTLAVSGTVSAGGSSGQTSKTTQSRFDFQENGTYERGKHLLRAGFRYRLYHDTSTSTGGFNGTFTFPDLASYQASILGTPSASQFQITTGRTNFSVMTGDFAAWLEDEWKPRKDLTVDLGFRFESQSAIPDHSDPAPRIGIAWAVRQKGNKPAHVVLRAGSGIFYDRFPIADLMTAVRQGDPSVRTSYTIASPTFFTTTASSTQAAFASYLASHPNTAATALTTYRVAPNFRSEYEIAAGLGADVSLGKHGSLGMEYVYRHGAHQWLSRNANAPRADGTRPYGAAAGTIDEFSSEGDSGGNLFFLHAQVRLPKGLSGWGFFFSPGYSTDASGPGSFASNSYNIRQDYGPAVWDRKGVLYTGLDEKLKWDISLSAFLALQGGKPFNITTGADNNGDTIYNDRPAFATAATNPADVVHTAYGNFDTNPQPGEQIIPFDYGRAARFVSLQLAGSKTVKFGPAQKADPDAPAPPPGKPVPRPDPRFALTFSVEAQNVTNTVDPANPVGVLNSPFFGRALSTANTFLTTSAANRTITLQTTFRF